MSPQPLLSNSSPASAAHSGKWCGDGMRGSPELGWQTRGYGAFLPFRLSFGGAVDRCLDFFTLSRKIPHIANHSLRRCCQLPCPLYRHPQCILCLNANNRGYGVMGTRQDHSFLPHARTTACSTTHWWKGIRPPPTQIDRMFIISRRLIHVICAINTCLYNTHIRQRMCRNAKCYRVGLPFPSENGLIYERTGHRKESIVT